MTNVRSPFRSILVPLDGSDLAAQALPLAARIARQSGGKLRLALVHEHPAVPPDAMAARTLTSVDLSAQKAERVYLRGVQAQLREDGIQTGSAVTLTGTVGPALVTYAHDLGIDLVVLATHGRGGISRMWLGSTADYLVRHLDVPVLVVRPGAGRRTEAPPGSGQMLVPLDGSPRAEEALAPAVELARVWDLEVRLLRVVGPIVTADTAYPVSARYDEDLTAMARASAQAYLDQVILCLHGQGIRATGAAVIGASTAETILDQARGGQVKMLAIATHGRGALGRLMLGSVADKLVRGAEVPVLVRRPVKDAPPAPSAPRPRGLRGKIRQRA
jgi:nucleotide-binding universal stress UspA family protein